jgi:hypothetical protein
LQGLWPGKQGTLNIYKGYKEMKKSIVKTNLLIAVFCFSMSMGLPGQAMATWLESYYKTHPMSADQLKASWGEPVNVIKMAGGVEKLIFGPKDVEVGYTYFLTRAGRVIDRGTTEDDGIENVSRTGKDPEPCSLMGNYYKTHPMTMDELTAKWGTPVSSYDYNNGIKKLVFGPKDVVIGYTYFLIKDGMVVDYNVTSEK